MKIFDKIAAIPRLDRVLLPTPLEYLDHLSALCGHTVYMKRDDLSGHCFGGNKERKLDYIIKDAVLNGHRTLLTLGAAHSNHCRMTAAIGSAQGMNVELIIISDNPALDRSEGNMMLDVMFDAKINIVPSLLVQNAIDERMNSIDKPYFIEGGGHCVLGLIAYVAAARELKLQCDGIGLCPEYIVVPCGTGTTLAGIALGCSLMEWDVKVRGISVARSAVRCGEEVDSISLKGCEYLELPPRETEYDIYDQYIGSGYGELYRECTDILFRVAKLESVMLDPVYNAKAMTGMLAEMESGNISGPVVYWNTGGQPALFIEKYRRELCSRVK